MKPWFEKESNVIKFPTPKAKVIQMPNVQSYPDFLTGVKDLHNRKAKGEISQQSHDKLYQDLIHRFMKKESFERPWFIKEADLSKVSPSSRAKYLNAVNQMLQKNQSLAIGNTGETMFQPDPGQKITDLNFGDTIIGKVGNKQTTIKARQIYKGSELKGDRKYYNVGYVSEGLFLSLIHI